ncbi:lanthionine synthetase LanC family protein [Hymenobacter negativus]|uniref:DUF4243 domain-containing protein n=1 Tax=Hymenobacter negativus TaxID=2795026 RepID=A0ABS3QQ64_9BACT|nr:lanthionine synthetase LanC family protein [Hymenobacter negativus]MBO2013073.1 hypothetical protein [Hymenobacter negativus]
MKANHPMGMQESSSTNYPSGRFPTDVFAMQNRPLTVAQSWQEVHQVLTSTSPASAAPPDLFGIAIYHYCVYKAIGREHALLAHRSFDQLIAHLDQHPVEVWTGPALNQVCMAAWLSSQPAPAGFLTTASQATLARLDQALQAEALRLLQRSDETSRSNFFRIVRYFALRPSIPFVSNCLRQLLAMPVLFTYAEPLQLGLSAGLADELLVLINLCHAGVSDTESKQRIHIGIQRILATKRNIDFSEQQYSVFPYQVHNQLKETTFSSELSWRRGDIGQSFLLYKAHSLSQDPDLLNIAELVGLNTLLRTTSDNTEVVSSQLESGAAGLAHIYHKLCQLSGNEAYQRGQIYWLTQTQQWLRQELANDIYNNRLGDLLQGLVGVGLVLLSAMTEKELKWDEIVL